MDAREELMQKVADLPDAIPSNRFLVFAMSLLLNTEEYVRVYGDHVLDETRDKKVDFFHIDIETGRAIVAQAFETPNWEKGLSDGREPPANKASDLNTALAWLLDSDIENIPSDAVRSAARELRDGLQSGDVHTVVLYFVHNLAHCDNVDKELATVRSNLIGRLARWQTEPNFPLLADARQLGIDDVVVLYKSQYSSIRIDDDIPVETEGRAVTIKGPNWKAHFATVPGSALVGLVQRYGENLYSANIRDYLGARTSRQNINKKIEETALINPENFWVFNNGVTLVSRRVGVDDDCLRCGGLAVVNGAQTLGSLHRASENGQIDKVKVLVRVVESGSEELIQNIIRYNNTQNPIKPWELRVLDPVQKKIGEEFAKLSITYQFRRGLDRRSALDVHSDKLGPWLNSFYGDPITSHRNSPQLFDNENTYRRLFPVAFDVKHLLLVYRLGEAVSATKDEYRALVGAGRASSDESEVYGYSRYSAFLHVALYLCGEVLAASFGGGSGVIARLILGEDLLRNRDSAVENLKSLVKWTLAPIPAQLIKKDAYQQFRSMDGVKAIAAHLRTLVGQWKAVPRMREELNSMIEGITLS